MMKWVIDKGLTEKRVDTSLSISEWKDMTQIARETGQTVKAFVREAINRRVRNLVERPRSATLGPIKTFPDEGNGQP